MPELDPALLCTQGRITRDGTSNVRSLLGLRARSLGAQIDPPG